MSAGDDRDRVMGHLLKRSRRVDADPPATGECLDAETMAAWLDGGLDEPARMAAVSHAADCARCQAMLGAIAHAAPVAAAPLPWWRRQWSSWLVPLTAAAAAVTLWMVVPGQRGGEPRPSGSQFEERPATVAEVAPRPAAEAGPQPTPQEPFAQPSGAAAPAPSAPKDLAAANRRAQAAPPAGAVPAEPPAAAAPTDPRAAAAPTDPRAAAAPPLPQAAPVPSDDLRRRDQDRLADAARPGPAPAKLDEAKREEDQRAAAKEAVAQAERQDRPEAPAAKRAAAPPAIAATASPPASAAAAGGRMAGQAVGRDVASPDPAVRWRIGGGAVLRSVDGGATWEPIADQRAADVLAAAAPSRDVCWLVGRNGLVMRTEDGRRFTRLAFPEASSLVSVRAIGVTTALVTTEAGRTFRTDDAGRTWTPQ